MPSAELGGGGLLGFRVLGFRVYKGLGFRGLRVYRRVKGLGFKGLGFRVYRDNGKENGNYYTFIGVYRDN